jgi:hypothetical protein
MSSVNEVIAQVRQRLIEKGAVQVDLTNGSRLFMVTMPLFGVNTRELLVTYEGGGSVVYAGDRPLNNFRLVQHGFPFSAAGEVADLVNAVAGVSGEAPHDTQSLTEGTHK